MSPENYNFDQIYQVMRQLRRLSGQFDAEIAKAVNEGGQDLYDHSVYAIAEYYGIAPEAIKYGIDRRFATSRDQTYTQIGSGGDVPYVIWHTANDEKVCAICGPREGQIFPIEDKDEVWPAHPYCRCWLEPVNIATSMLDTAEEGLEEAIQTTTEEILAVFSKLFGDVKP